MSKPKLPNQRDAILDLKKRIERYMLLVRGVYDTYNLEASKMALRTGYDGEKPFSFSDYPTIKKQVEKLLANWCGDMSAVIYRTTSEEWKKSNLMQDLIADKVMAYYFGQAQGKRIRKYYQTNSDALQAFQARRDYGMNLSQRIWNQSRLYKKGLEDALSVGIQKGMSAITLSKRISKYLQDYPQLQKDYKEKYGKATDGGNCEYRSFRLARNEINLAYRTAEQKRWEQFDFIIGKEIKTSNVHEEKMPNGDICDDLAGKYPKDFLWRCWHPNCMCYEVPIIRKDYDFFAPDDAPAENEVTDVPQNYKEWIKDNVDRIQRAEQRRTLPYFIKDNSKVTNAILKEVEIHSELVSSKDVDYLVARGFVDKSVEEFARKILTSNSPDVAQRRLEQLFVSPNVSSAIEIAKGYAERNPEIEVLLSSIERLRGKDGIEVLKTISHLKDICAKETVQDLTSWGYVDGMEYKGLTKSVILSPLHQKVTKQGVKVEIPETRADILLFKDENGKQFAYPLGAHKGMFNASVASDVIQEFPPYLRRGIRRVSFLDRPNPYDLFWKIEYENPNHVSAATDGGRTTFWVTPEDKEQFRKYMAHEAGHIWDGDAKHILSSSKEWLEAVEADDEWYKSHGLKRKIHVSGYAKTNNSEDFAECMCYYIVDHDNFKEYFPNRAAFIRKKAQEYSKR